MAAVTICSDLEPPEIKSVTVFTVSLPICHEVMGPDAMILLFWILSFKPTFSLYSFAFIRRLFSSSSLSAIRVVSSVYLRLLIFLPAILIPACVSSSLAFLMMYSAYKLNKQGDNMQPWCPPLPIWNQSVVLCPVLTAASWPPYRFLRRKFVFLRRKFVCCLIDGLKVIMCQSLGSNKGGQFALKGFGEGTWLTGCLIFESTSIYWGSTLCNTPG